MGDDSLRVMGDDSLARESVSDVVGGRVLAWLGAVMTLIGIVLLLGLAISHGWIGPAGRVGLAAVGCAALLGGGIWLHARGGRTEAAVAMVGAATAGAFATLIVAGSVYELIPAIAAVLGALMVGAVATTLAVRWAGRAIAVVGLNGALLSPLLVGAPRDAAMIVMLAVAAGCATWVVLWRRWAWQAFAILLLTVPQWGAWMVDGHPLVANLSVLVLFGSLGLIAAVLTQLRSPHEDRLLAAAAAVALLNAVIVGLAGRLALGTTAGELWLAGLALVHLIVGGRRWPRLAIQPSLRRLLIAIAVLAADVALGLALHGIAQTAAWAAVALGFAVLVRRAGRGGGRDGAWLGSALGLHLGLVLARALFELPPAQLAAGAQLGPLISVAILAGSLVACGQIAAARRTPTRIVLDGLGILALGYLTAGGLSGPAEVGAWAFEAAALLGLGWSSSDPVAKAAGIGFLGAAGVHVLAVEAPVRSLLDGAPNLGVAALGLGALVAAALVAGLAPGARGELRRSLLAISSLAALYLASIAIISLCQPAYGTAPDSLFELGVRQQGQVLLSALWGLVGVSGLIVGLRRGLRPLRTAALVLLLTTVAKVFLYDLAALTSIYRVISFLMLGGLLLAGAFAYQRLRPPPPPDLRTLHPTQR